MKTLLTIPEMDSLIQDMERTHRECLKKAAPEQRAILEENLAAVKAAVEACANLMRTIGQPDA